MKRVLLFLLVLILVSAAAYAQAEGAFDSDPAHFTYEPLGDSGGIEITGYTGSSPNVDVPAEIDGRPVTSIGYQALGYRDDIVSLILPDSIPGSRFLFKEDKVSDYKKCDSYGNAGNDYYLFFHMIVCSFPVFLIYPRKFCICVFL